MKKKIQKITPFLWFDHQAEEAAKFYVDIFNGSPRSNGDSMIGNINKYDEAGSEVSGQPKGSTMVVDFYLEGQEFNAINGGSYFKFSGAISFVVNCKTQEEVDYFWEKLSEGGEKGQCGWINRDKFGVTWQVVPEGMDNLIGGKNKEGSERAMRAMIKMTKLDIKKLKQAYEGK